MTVDALLDLLLASPLEAFPLDCQTHDGGNDADDSDVALVEVTHVLRCVLDAPPAQRASLVARLVQAPGQGPGMLPQALLNALRDLTVSSPEACGAHALLLADHVQSLAASAEQRGRFRLVFLLLDATRRLLERSSKPVTAAGLYAQQGRVARQLGVLAVAQERYERAESIARRTGDAGVLGRARLGLGVLANTRGNYPDARSHFRRALSLGRRLRHREFIRAANQGLLHAALVSHDYDAALQHGWEALRLSGGTSEEVAELLTNMAEISRAIGATEAARNAYRVAMDLSVLPRIRMAALGGAITLEATCGDSERMAPLITEADGAVVQSQAPYDRAMLWAVTAEAYAVVGRWAAAQPRVSHAEEIAARHGFHEIAHRMQRLRDDMTAAMAAAGTAARPKPLIKLTLAAAPLRLGQFPRAGDSITEPAIAPLSRRSARVLRGLASLRSEDAVVLTA